MVEVEWEGVGVGIPWDGEALSGGTVRVEWGRVGWGFRIFRRTVKRMAMRFERPDTARCSTK